MVVFPSWLPFFLPQSSRKDKTQRTQSPQDAKKTTQRNDKNTQSATTKAAAQNTGRNARKKPALIQNPAFIPQIPPN